LPIDVVVPFGRIGSAGNESFMLRIIGLPALDDIGEGWRFWGRVIPHAWVLGDGERMMGECVGNSREFGDRRPIGSGSGD
jgi:hypothetical protein